MDSADISRRFAQQLGIDYPLLSDPKRQAASAYGVVASGQPFASRWTFYISSQGTILYIDKQVGPTTHGRAIAQKLAELGVPKRVRTRR